MWSQTCLLWITSQGRKILPVDSLPEFPANILSMSAVWCQYLIMDLLQLAPAWIETVGKAHVSVQYFLGRVRTMCALPLLGLVGSVAELPALWAGGQPFNLCHMLNVISGSMTKVWFLAHWNYTENHTFLLYLIEPVMRSSVTLQQ